MGAIRAASRAVLRTGHPVRTPHTRRCTPHRSATISRGTSTFLPERIGEEPAG
ncbi:hypothetical protein ACWDE9_45690 [Streptomyces olivaceoviridis]